MYLNIIYHNILIHQVSQILKMHVQVLKENKEETIKNRMAAEVNPVLGTPLFNFASGVSLLLFYAFAMQCMSTLAIVKRETNSWKWPMWQLFAMSAIAYVVALAAYQLLK